MYDTHEDATQALSGTIVLFNHNPFYVDHVLGNAVPFSLAAYRLPMTRDQRFDTIALTAPGLNFNKYRLGYLNPTTGDNANWAGYVSRLPARQWKQGISDGNCHVYFPQVGGGDIGRGQAITNFLRDPGLLDMFRGVYPSVEEAARKLQKLNTPNNPRRFIIAISPDIAIGPDDFRKDYIVYYRNERVGWSDLGSIMLPTEFEHLQQVLSEKSGIKNVKNIG